MRIPQGRPVNARVYSLTEGFTAQEGPKKLPDGSVDWAEYNARQRGTVQMLASLDPKEDFIVICTMMKPAIHFMQEAQHISSEDWQNKQFANTLEGKVGGFRIHRAALGTLCTVFLQELQGLIAGPAAWDLIPPTSQTVARASLIWAMFAQLFSSTHRLLVKEEKNIHTSSSGYWNLIFQSGKQ